MNGNRLTRLSLAIGLCASATAALASPQQFNSARSFGMAGTGVAVAQPADAAAKNPAMMAAEQHEWSDDFGLMLPSANARFADDEQTGDQVDDIQDTIDAIDSAIASSNLPEAQSNANQLRTQLQAFDRDTVRANAGLGLALAFPSTSVSVGFFANGTLTATARGEYDEGDDATLAAIAAGDPTASTDDLESRGKILASSVSELGISVARSFDMADGNTLQLGLSPKYVDLRTFQYTETVQTYDDEDFDSSEYETSDSGFNIDLGAAYTFGEEQDWTLGAALKNLIPMDLKSARTKPGLEQQRTLKVDPTVSVGIAHKSAHHVVTAEIDLTKKEAFGFEDDTQWLALGAEFDAWRYAQLRVGVRQNLASNDDNDGIEEKTQFTAGLGVNLLGARLDLGALFSDAEVGAALEFGATF